MCPSHPARAGWDPHPPHLLLGKSISFPAMPKEGLGGTSRTSSPPGSQINGVRQDLQLTVSKICICSSFSGNQDSLIRRVSIQRPDLWGGPSFPYHTFIQHLLLTGKHLEGFYLFYCHGAGRHSAMSGLLNDLSWYCCLLVGSLLHDFQPLCPPSKVAVSMGKTLHAMLAVELFPRDRVRQLWSEANPSQGLF